MPPSSDQPSSYQHQAVDPALYPQEEAPRKRSPGRRGQGKKNRRYEAAGDNVEEKRSSTGLPPAAMTSPPSILSQLHASTSPPPVPTNGASSPSLETWESTPTRQPHDHIREPAADWSQPLPHGLSPPYNSSNRASVGGSPPQHKIYPEGLRGGFTNISPPISPRAAYRQPIHRASDYQSFGDYLGSSPNRRRPPSTHSQNSHYPPQPHHPQAHFYTAPEIDFGMAPPIFEDRKSTEGCCCIFDNLFSASKEGTGNPESVLLAGFDHGLDVYHVDKKRFSHIGRLNGLRGSVIGARILPFQPRNGIQATHPFVVVVVHGPYVQPASSSQPENGRGEDEEFDPSRSMLQAMQVADTSHYQTTVEVYSLSSGDHVATLLRNPKVEARLAYDGHPSQNPSTGDLSIQANGKFVVVSSGSSGEVYVFESAHTERAHRPLQFKCIGKIWTRTSVSPQTASNDFDPGRLHDTPGRKPDAAILSLSNRWLAVVPPPSSSQTTIHSQVETITSNKTPGLNSHTPPIEPYVTCDLDTPKDGSVLNRVARDVAQGALKSAQWVAAEGFQVWNNYWTKPSDQVRHAGSPPSHGSVTPLPSPQSFPPTHAQDNVKDRARGQPTLVSILDLERLSQSQHIKPSLALQPLATFSLQLGCSVLSFSPSGLNLLTASTKGDIQVVWDLMRMVHGEAGRVGDPEASPKGPSVRQIASFSRMTEARIIDVIWTEPRGERFATITERGTVHINELPLAAFQWPPYRREQRSVGPANDETKSDSKGSDAARPQSVGSTFGSTFGMFASRTQTALASVRGRSPSTNSGFSGFGSLAMTAGAGAKGGKAVAAGINRSVSAAAAGTVNTIRHYGENRLALPSSAHPVSPRCAQWLGGKSQGFLAVTGRGAVRVYSIRRSSNPKAGQRRPSVVVDKPIEFSILGKERSNQRGPGGNAQAGKTASSSSGSFWLPQASRPPSRSSNLDMHPLSYAEIETNAPYQPFHTDRRVNLFMYDDNALLSADPQHLHDSSPWTFGEVIPAIKISAGSAKNEEGDGVGAGLGQMENEIRMEGNVEDGQRVVSTTTRRKKSKKGVGNDDGVDDGSFFEDDCEVLEISEGVNS